MRRFVAAPCATALGLALSAVCAASASASATIVVWPGQSIQAAVNRANPGDTVLVKRGVYHQSVLISKNRITLRGAGDFLGGTVLKPPASVPENLCNTVFGPTGVCIFAKKVDTETGAVIKAVHDDTVTAMYVTGFQGNGVFGYGADDLRVTHVKAVDDGEYGISRFASSETLFADDVAAGNDEAGFYVGDSPDADTVVRHNRAFGNALGIFIRHARHVTITGNRATGNCQGILVLDDGQPGGAGDAVIRHNKVFSNNKFCPANEEAPPLQGGGILLLGATHTRVAANHVAGNVGQQVNSGGIVVASAQSLTGGSDPSHITIIHNSAFGDQPADLIWDGTGTGVSFTHNHCGTSLPIGFCS